MKLILRLVTLLLGLSATLPAGTTPELGIRDKTPTLTAYTGATVIISPERTAEDAGELQ